MKKLMHTVARAAARWALSYTGAAARWALDKAADAATRKAWVQALASWAADAASLFAVFAAALEDGKVTQEERDSVAEEAQRVADRARELLK